MKEFVLLLFFFILQVGMPGCNELGDLSTQSLNECEKVAELKQIDSHKVIVCDAELLHDTIVLPLSYFTEELQIVKLDNNKEAFVDIDAVIIGERYILIGRGYTSIPCKLFDKSGRFIANVGTYGKGQGEYHDYVRYMQLDESNKLIYLLAQSDDKILTYDLNGRYLDMIRLPTRLARGKFYVNHADSTVSIVSLPLNEGRFSVLYFAWSQTLSGKIINGLPPGSLSIENEYVLSGFYDIISGVNVKGFDFMFYNSLSPRKDTLYHYDVKNNYLSPKFTVDFKNRSTPIHYYFELPHHYVGCTTELKEGKIHGGYWEINPKSFIVEKTTMKGAYFKLVNDFLGNMEVNWPCHRFSNGYYTINYDPADLLEKLENTLANNKMSPEMRKKLVDLKNDIRETDNNYILYAKLK